MAITGKQVSLCGEANATSFTKKTFERKELTRPYLSFFLYTYVDFYVFLDSESEIVGEFSDEIFLKPSISPNFYFCILLVIYWPWNINAKLIQVPDKRLNLKFFWGGCFWEIK